MTETPPHQTRAAPSAQQPQPSAEPSDGGTAGIDVPTPSTKTIVVLAVVAIALFFLIRRLRSSGDSDESGADGETDADPEEIEVPEEIAEEFDAVEEGETIRVPTNPDSELEKDEAVIEGLKDAGLLDLEGDG